MSTALPTVTAASSSTVHLPPPRTRTRISQEVAALRDVLDLCSSSVRDLHNGVRASELEAETDQLARREPRELLEALSLHRGLSWVMMGRLVGVSIPALRKWRHGEKVVGENRRKLAALTAFLNALARAPVAEPASWMEMRIAADTTLTPADIYLGDRVDLLLEHAFGRIDGHELLDRYDPDWRHQHPADERFVAVRAEDGDISLMERQAR